MDPIGVSRNVRNGWSDHRLIRGVGERGVLGKLLGVAARAREEPRGSAVAGVRWGVAAQRRLGGGAVAPLARRWVRGCMVAAGIRACLGAVAAVAAREPAARDFQELVQDEEFELQLEGVAEVLQGLPAQALISLELRNRAW